MTEQEKQLLLADLCARLPYGVKVWYKYETWNSKKFATSIRLADEKIALSSKFNKEGDWFSVEEAGEILIKPYLRPISNMTEQERKEYNKVMFQSERYENDYTDVDWLNRHHFDYRGLIDKGLGIEAPEGMYN